MSHGIKIRAVEINGEKRMPPECMRILLDFAGHRDICDQCIHAYENRLPAEAYCATGYRLLEELSKQPEVESLP